jgi:hypothetical protein
MSENRLERSRDAALGLVLGAGTFGDAFTAGNVGTGGGGGGGGKGRLTGGGGGGGVEMTGAGMTGGGGGGTGKCLTVLMFSVS